VLVEAYQFEHLYEGSKVANFAYGRFFKRHTLAFRALVGHGMLSSDSDSRCKRYSYKSSCELSSISSVSMPYSSPRTHRTIPAVT
jgi:hypothetical protein